VRGGGPGASPMVGDPPACDDRGVAMTRGGKQPAGAPGAPPAEADAPARPRFVRRRDGKLLGGVASGLADHLGLNPLHVRAAFALLTGLGGIGPLLYGGYWVVVPQAPPAGSDAPAGLAAAGRRGSRLLPGRAGGDDSYGQLIALGMVGLGFVLLLQHTDLGIPPVLLWPALAVAAGLAVLWHQADEADLARAAGGAPGGADGPALDARADRRRRTFAVARFAGGVVLVGLGVASFLAFSGGLAAAGQGLAGGAVVAGGAALIAGPWLLRTWRSLAEERRERIRSQMHADMAAHLHDSVLQTLALIQRQASDPREVVRLARGQERDLRAFLYRDAHAPGAAPDETFAVALRRVAGEVEDDHGVPVEVVTVGDLPLGDGTRALLASAREAMANAARHSGATLVDVYAEVDGSAVTAYVRDRGRGFDLDAVPEDRAGVRHSIVGRMERHGGRAVVRTAPGEGTEIRLQTEP
jgi:signal transduction histidine kinase/phage shock protein PspC (stress-responsive transcriptional regulator)